MNVDRERGQALLSWSIIAALAALSLSLGVLQYRWIGELSRADRERLQSSLQTSLNRLSEAFNTDLAAACTSLLPGRAVLDRDVRREQYAARFFQWRESSGHGRLFRSVSLAIPEGDSLHLEILDPQTGQFRRSEWSESWIKIRDRLLSKISRATPPDQRFPGSAAEDYSSIVEFPYFGPPSGSPQPPREIEWLILDLDLDYISSAIIPSLLQRYLGGDYEADIVTSSSPSTLIYSSERRAIPSVSGRPDGSVRLFDEAILRRGQFRPSRPFERSDFRRPPPGAPPRAFDRGRWTLFVRHRSGSLDAVVTKVRWRNLAISMGMLLLISGAVAALVRFSRRAQALAELQMEFVAGVSHELRTPLSVMRTAGHNLQGQLAKDPARVQQYGALIAAESEKLTGIVEQVLRFANAKAGRVIGRVGTVRVPGLISDAIEADRLLIEEAGCTIEKKIEPALPEIAGDAMTLKHALQNLVSNAVKYGGKGGWIGVSAAAETDRNGPAVVIRIADRGPGISQREIEQIFDPFYRGRSAIENQIHGTGLGLSLTKRIVEAHGGTIAVHSEPSMGTEFVVRIPAATNGQHEFANSPDRG